MSPHIDIPLTLLDRYLAGECSSDESATVRQWLSEHPSHETILAQVGTVQHVVAQDPVWNSDSMWETIATEVTGQSEALSKPHKSKRSSPVTNWWSTPSVSVRWLGLGAVVFAAAFSGIVIGVKTFAARTDHQMLKQATYHTVNTLRGQRAQFQLPDGSTALLGPDTRLRYHSMAGQQERVVELYGEALFTVTHAAGAPFIVRVNGTTVRVLGTTFAVRKYNDDTLSHVVVAEGRVAVSSGSATQPVVLSTGERVQIDSRGAMTLERAVNIGSALAWTQGRLDFTRTPLRTVIADVARMYDIELRIASPALANQLVTGAVDDRLSPSDALEMLAGMVGGRIERSKDGFIFKER